MREIAQAAGVSAQTVYDSVGSKQAVVAQLNDLIDIEAGIGDIVRVAVGSGDPRETAAAPARVTRSILENCGDIIRALVTGAAAEPELAAVLAEGHRRHVDGARRIVALLERLESLDPAAEPGQAAETLAALSDVTFALMLRDDYGWSPERIETWIADTSRTLLLR
jgi:AcrR family transcriptional regulator